LRKLEDKRQTEQQQKQEEHAVSLFYEMQTSPVRRPINTEPTSRVSVLTDDPVKSSSGQPLPDQSPYKGAVSGFDDAAPDNASSRVVANPARVNASPAQSGASWVFVFDRLLREIKIKHYSPKTLEAYQGWTRQFQAYNKKQRLPVALRARCDRVFESPYGTKCHAEGGEESSGFLRLPLSRSRRSHSAFDLAQALPARIERWAAFSGLIQGETCGQGREWFSPEAQESTADTPSAFGRCVVAAFGAGHQFLGAFDGGGVKLDADGSPGAVTLNVGGFVTNRVLVANIVGDLGAKSLDFVR